jgi:aryl-alcohol dehydrogenase-like predicted oxidoreductase
MRFAEVLGERISKIGLGTWQFGSAEWGYGSDYAGGGAPAIVAKALECGVNLFDTAEIYAFGKSEEILGRALSGQRERAFIASKVWPWLAFGPLVKRAARNSAKRLGVTSIDLFQLHWPSPHIPLSNTMGGFRELLAEGTIRHAGVSNYSLQGWQRAEEALGAPVLSNQVPYSLL